MRTQENSGVGYILYIFSYYLKDTVSKDIDILSMIRINHIDK